MRSQFPSAFVALALLCTSFNAAAEAPRIHATAAAVHAVGGHQKDEFGWGAAALPALEYPVTAAFGLQLEMSALWLSEGSPPVDPNVEPEGDATAFAAMFGPRLRPFARAHDGTALSPAGFWLSGGLGVATTNALWRPVVDAQIGYDFLDKRARTGLGPMIGYQHVFQPDKELRPDDASLLMVGVHALFDLSPTSAQRRDADGDGIYDDADKCPQVPEDPDDFQDDDGCPELDNDNDGIADAKDRCPNEPEDKDGFEDGDGCPELDNDKDGIPDATDKCPLEAEDRDGFDDEDGCPDPDNDKDGIPDVSDLCPFEPETVNDYADTDGCPDEDQVRVIGDQIVLDDRVHFWVNSHIIRRDSFPLLQRLAKLIGDHPEYVQIDIAGHADERGPDSFNIPLSKNRARAVLEFLVKAGIPRERLNAEGFGETKPLIDRKSEHAYYKNRRV
ncbi:MAG TPA: OmpA family protein, partial [Polyangiaceae bacterium]|nr:OmpA family protein [Polyangiaceae bacterium]